MANNKNNVQPKVVTTTTTTTSRRRGRRRRRTPRAATVSKTTVRKVASLGQSRRPLRRRFGRSGTSTQPSGTTFRQKITATLGTIGSNQGNNIELEASVLLNPALMKETTGSNAFGPLQMYAANYSLWRARDIILKLTPLVGGSAVSGTAIRASLNLSAQPGSPSWSALGARRHRDTNPGRPMTMRIPGSAILGPKEGWFLCNTKNDPMMCIAGSIEVHTLGKTLSTYKNEDFTGPLFLAELTATWEFKNYNPEPGMLNLMKTRITEQPETIKINSKPGEPIDISVPATSRLARVTGGLEVAADAPASEIIWQICDTTVDLMKGALPVPFNWLFQAGWWFVKRIANKKKTGDHVDGEPDPGEVVFRVYQSISDAQNDVPCIATSQAASTNVTLTGLEIMQITPGNVGMPQENLMSLRSIPTPTTGDFLLASTSFTGQPPLYGHNHTDVPVACFVAQSTDGSNKKVYSCAYRELKDPVFIQGGDEINPAEIQSSSYPILTKEGSSYNKIGDVYGAQYYQAATPSPVVNWTIVLWRASETRQVKLQSNNNTTDQWFYMSKRLKNDNALARFDDVLMVTPQFSLVQNIVTITQGNWYLTVFSAIGGRSEFSNYGIPFYLSTTAASTSPTTYDLPNAAEEAGLSSTTGGFLKFTPPTATTSALTASELAQIRQLLAPRDIYPPSEYDNLDMPPLEGDDEEEQGASGGAELQRDIKNWVEFGHRKRPPTPFSPIEEEEEDEEESDLDDDDYAEVPSFVKNLLTPEAKKLLDDLKKMGLSHEKAVKAAQGAYPHPAVEKWEAAYHNALVDGLSPPSARDCAWGEISDYL